MNNEKKSGRIARLRPFVFFLPAALTLAIIAAALPKTKPVFADLPERLERIDGSMLKKSVGSSQKTAADDLSEAAETTDTENASGEALPVGNYKDGVFTGSARGYGGNIKAEVTVENGRIISVRIVDASGDNEPYLTLAKRTISGIIEQQTWEIDTVSGATYSSRGILGAVKNALTGETVQNKAPKKTVPAGSKVQDKFTEPAAYKDGKYYGSAQGFGGAIKVEVVIEGGAIKDVRIVSAASETAEYMSRARNILSAIVSSGSPNVDAVSGATYSSTGIINAVKRALKDAAAGSAAGQPQTNDSGAATEPQTDGPGEDQPKDMVTAPADITAKPPLLLADGVYEGVGEGFGGDVAVQVTVSGGRIAQIRVLSAADETPAYFNRAFEVLTMIVGRQNTDIDAVSGATYSSEGLMEAVREALTKAAKAASSGEPSSERPSSEQPSSEKLSSEQPSSEKPSGERPSSEQPSSAGASSEMPSSSEPSSEQPSGENPPAEEPTAGTDSSSPYLDGSYTASGWCVDEDDTFRYKLSVTVEIAGGRIVAVHVERSEDESDDPEANDKYLGYAENGRTRKGVDYVGIPAQIVEKQGADGVDAVSGATYSSDTIRGLAAEALKAAGK